MTHENSIQLQTESFYLYFDADRTLDANVRQKANHFEQVSVEKK